MLEVVPSWSKLGQRVPLEESPEDEMMVLTLIPPTRGDDDRYKVYTDLVFVLDTSASMQGEKLAKMKEVMTKVIDNWIRKEDRLCIISFSTEASIVRPLSPVDTDTKKAAAKELVKSLDAVGWTNMQKGLELALKQIKKTETTIVLMSDGAENNGSKARSVVIEDIPVDTIGFGTGQDGNVLYDIAKHSEDGVYAACPNISQLASVMSPILDYWKHIRVKDLELTVQPKDPRISLQVTYKKTKNGTPGDAVSTKVAHLSDYSKRVHVYFKVPPSAQGGKKTLMTVSWNYKRMPGRDTVTNSTSYPPIQVFVVYTGFAAPRARALVIDDVIQIPKPVKTEQIRLRHVAMIKEVRKSADAGKYDEAREKLWDGMSELDKARGMADSHVSKSAIEYFYGEVEILLTATESEDEYKQRGQFSVVASISSHKSQRYAARGDDDCGVRLFASERTIQYLVEAIAFDRMSCTATA